MDNIMDFLNNYSLLKCKEVDLNFFRIAGFPHYENVSSNILRFYFEKCDIVLKAFLNCISPEYSRSINLIEKVEREEKTPKNKRIDIVVYTNKYIIGIENKINANLNNPIDDYSNHLYDKAQKECKEYLLIVLSKKEIKSNTKYKNILYKDFSAELKKYYPELLNSLGYRYFSFLTEYIANIDLLEGGFFMNKEFVEIAKNNKEKIIQIMNEGNHLRNDIKNMAYQIMNDFQEYSKSFLEQSVEQEKDEICATVFFQNCNLHNSKYNVTIEVIVDVDGFEIQIYENNNQYNPEFANFLLKEILSPKEYKITDSTRVNYNNELRIDEDEKLKNILIGIFKAFDDYKSKN